MQVALERRDIGEKHGMKGDVERREGNEEARLKETILVIKASGCGEFGHVRAWVSEDQWLQDAEEGSKGLRIKAVLEEPRAAKKGASGPLHERYENEWRVRGYPLLVPDGVSRRLQ